jgi:hypothetical protein
MSLAELIPQVQTLRKADKLQLVHFLVEDLAHDDGDIRPGIAYPVWTPLNAHDAARRLFHAVSN